MIGHPLIAGSPILETLATKNFYFSYYYGCFTTLAGFGTYGLKANQSRCVCPAWASLSYLSYGINLEGASPLWARVTLRQKLRGVRPEPLVSCKVASCETRTEGYLRLTSE